jgi:hypothetical protein
MYTITTNPKEWKTDAHHMQIKLLLLGKASWLNPRAVQESHPLHLVMFLHLEMNAAP